MSFWARGRFRHVLISLRSDSTRGGANCCISYNLVLSTPMRPQDGRRPDSLLEPYLTGPHMRRCARIRPSSRISNFGAMATDEGSVLNPWPYTMTHHAVKHMASRSPLRKCLCDHQADCTSGVINESFCFQHLCKKDLVKKLDQRSRLVAHVLVAAGEAQCLDHPEQQTVIESDHCKAAAEVAIAPASLT